MSCSEDREHLPLFVDGELDSRRMLAVARHCTTCSPCSEEVRELEHMRELIAGCVDERVDEIDLARIWTAVEPRIGTPALSWSARLRRRGDPGEFSWRLKVPAYAALAAAAVFALLFWRSTTAVGPNPVQVADNSAIIDTVDSHVDNFAVFSEPESNTMVLWVSDDGGLGDLR